MIGLQVFPHSLLSQEHKKGENMGEITKTAFIGIDAGTTGATVAIYDEKGNELAIGYKEYACTFPRGDSPSSPTSPPKVNLPSAPIESRTSPT